RQTRAGMGRRQVDPQAAPRHREEERLHLRGVVQADQGLDHSSRTADQMTSAQASYWLSPGCRPSVAIHPVVPIALVLTAVRSTQVKARWLASSPAFALNLSVSTRIRIGSPYPLAAGTADQLGIDTATTRPGRSRRPATAS